jgi:Protein of unknown function (DUF1353)
MKKIAFSEKSTPIFIEKSSLPDPVIKYNEQKEIWILTENYTYQDDSFTIIVKKDFEFDLASVPRAFWWVISPFDLSIAAPLIHDFLYIHQGKPPQDTIIPYRQFTRLEADQLFDCIMEREGVATWRRAIAYRAVRLFGGFGSLDW